MYLYKFKRNLKIASHKITYRNGLRKIFPNHHIIELIVGEENTCTLYEYVVTSLNTLFI